MPYNDLNTIVFDGWNKVRETIINGVILTIKERGKENGSIKTI